MRGESRLPSWLAVVAASALVSCTQTDELTVTGAWLPPTVSGQTEAPAFMRLLSPRNATLVRVETDMAMAVEFHPTAHGDIAGPIRWPEALRLPAGQVVSLEPGGRHLMLSNLRQPLRSGDTVGMTLTLGVGQGRYTKVLAIAKVDERPGPEAER